MKINLLNLQCYLKILPSVLIYIGFSHISRIFSHPNVLPVVGAVTKAPNLMIISQYMPYGSLYDILHEGTGMYNINIGVKESHNDIFLVSLNTKYSLHFN